MTRVPILPLLTLTLVAFVPPYSLPC